MSLLSVSKAAAVLGVSERRVRQMLAEGVIEGARVGGSWVLDADAVDGARDIRPVGRPWKPKSAWAVLQVADGDSSGLSPVERSRASERLGRGVVAVLDRLRERAIRRSFYVHPSALELLRSSADVVSSGVSGGPFLGADIIVEGVLEGYVRASDLAHLQSNFALDAESERPNVVLRVVQDDVWPFGEGQQIAGRSVVAVDLLESDDPRIRRAGLQLIEDL